MLPPPPPPPTVTEMDPPTRHFQEARRDSLVFIKLNTEVGGLWRAAQQDLMLVGALMERVLHEMAQNLTVIAIKVSGRRQLFYVSILNIHTMGCGSR